MLAVIQFPWLQISFIVYFSPCIVKEQIEFILCHKVPLFVPMVTVFAPDFIIGFSDKSLFFSCIHIHLSFKSNPRVRHDWATELNSSLNKTFLEVYTNIQEINFQNHSDYLRGFWFNCRYNFFCFWLNTLKLQSLMIFNIMYFFNLFFYWRIIALQNSVVLHQTSTWISHRYTYIPSLLKFPPIALPILPF